ncbi:uncharacterized protein LOC134780036 [Penaeus indicus]|uniref:uncharacterized protein LOC134780036 n=1 Tax=Penaeus indicus TaxID=29960 RepID=UPI00300D19F6
MTTQGSSLFAPNYGQEPEWGQERPITFEDLGIPRSQAMRATVFGNIRTCQSLRPLEWILLVGGLLSTLGTIGLAIYRLFYLPPGSQDYVFAMLIIFHSAFCIIYIVDGVFREQAFEVLAFVASCIILIVYVVINYAKESSTSDTFKLVRLILTLVFGTSLGTIGTFLGYNYWQSGNLIFRTVGADSSIQAMCRVLFTTVTLILFDIQIVGSVVIMAMHHRLSELDLEEILTVTVGAPMLLAWATIAYLALRLESRYFFSIAMVLSPGHVAYLILSITQTAVKHETTLIAQCRYAASAGSLIVHLILIILMVKCYRNFGLGLKEKVYPPRTNEVRIQEDLVQ